MLKVHSKRIITDTRIKIIFEKRPRPLFLYPVPRDFKSRGTGCSCDSDGVGGVLLLLSLFFIPSSTGFEIPWNSIEIPWNGVEIPWNAVQYVKISFKHVWICFNSVFEILPNRCTNLALEIDRTCKVNPSDFAESPFVGDGSNTRFPW